MTIIFVYSATKFLFEKIIFPFRFVLLRLEVWVMLSCWLSNEGFPTAKLIKWQNTTLLKRIKNRLLIVSTPKNLSENNCDTNLLVLSFVLPRTGFWQLGSATAVSFYSALYYCLTSIHYYVYCQVTVFSNVSPGWCPHNQPFFWVDFVLCSLFVSNIEFDLHKSSQGLRERLDGHPFIVEQGKVVHNNIWYQTCLTDSVYLAIENGFKRCGTINGREIIHSRIDEIISCAR